MELMCRTGTIEANIGDTFTDKDAEWQIIGFNDAGHVMCRPAGELPDYWRKWARPDGSVAWCADSVAAMLLVKRDGLGRDARGGLLVKT